VAAFPAPPRTWPHLGFSEGSGRELPCRLNHLRRLDIGVVTLSRREAERMVEGLGLAIRQSLAEQIGGSLSVQSEPFHGATFHFTILAHATMDSRVGHIRFVRKRSFEQLFELGRRELPASNRECAVADSEEPE
jgi:hypothetical protein